jgi:hypothetical protein
LSVYEIGLLGEVSAEQAQVLTTTLGKMVTDFGLTIGGDVDVRAGLDVANRDRHAAFAAAYFGSAAQPQAAEALEVFEASLPIIPTVAHNGDFGVEVPGFLGGANGLRRRSDDPTMMELASALLECVGLLRRQRRVFVSYRRVESRQAAVQLHDMLGARGFDVFLDTHDIRPGEPFQDVLWHRLCDSDVMVMLDTPTYFDSKWTRQELGRALAKEIHVLRVVWPEHQPTRLTDFSETIYLDAAELERDDGPLIAATAYQIILAVESLRSRSIASRYMSITGRLRAEVTKIGGKVDGIGRHRAIAITLANNSKLWAYPVVGIPTADLFNDVAERARMADQKGVPVLVYDHVGIRDQWVAHLKWLDQNIASVRAIRISEAAWVLAGWEDEK